MENLPLNAQFYSICIYFLGSVTCVLSPVTLECFPSVGQFYEECREIKGGIRANVLSVPSPRYPQTLIFVIMITFIYIYCF